MSGIETCEQCGGEVLNDVTFNQFIETYGVRKSHIVQHGISYESLQKYGDTPIEKLPARFNRVFKDVLNRHGVKYATS